MRRKPAKAFSPCRRWLSDDRSDKLTIAEARDGLRAGEVTSVELTEACLAAIEGAGALNAFVHQDARDRAWIGRRPPMQRMGRW